MRRPFCWPLLILLTIPAYALDQDATTPDQKAVAAAPGRVEGSEEPIAIGAAMTGIIEFIAHQGDVISKGDVLAQIECGDKKARLAAQTAEYSAANAVHRKLVNGPRPEEIKIAEAEVALANARLEEAKVRATRSSTLLVRAAGSQATRDIDTRDVNMAGAQLESAKFRLQLLRAGTREEEIAEAESKVLAAKNMVAEAAAELAKCEVRSPIDGIVLHKEVSVGELVSIYYPKPLLTLSGVDKYRVRAEVDEQDVAKIRLGERAVVVNNSSGERLQGKVTEIAPVMGRKKILTSDPADKSDRDVMEVVVDLNEKPKNLPIGLRVSVIFLR